MDVRNENKQRVRVMLARRLQKFFIALRQSFPLDADALLQRVETEAAARNSEK
mgnify:CR=1 FL=1